MGPLLSSAMVNRNQEFTDLMPYNDVAFESLGIHNSLGTNNFFKFVQPYTGKVLPCDTTLEPNVCDLSLKNFFHLKAMI